jgi:hypothetical protein
MAQVAPQVMQLRHLKPKELLALMRFINQIIIRDLNAEPLAIENAIYLALPKYTEVQTALMSVYRYKEQNDHERQETD